MVGKALLILGHPNMEASIANKKLQELIKKNRLKIDTIDLTKEYSDFKIDVKMEQKRILKYDKIILQFPFYWFSWTPILKQYVDKVWTYGFAYGSKFSLKDKKVVLLTTTGGAIDAYSPNGYNKNSVEQFLIPITTTLRYVQLKHYGTLICYEAQQNLNKLEATVLKLKQILEL